MTTQTTTATIYPSVLFEDADAGMDWLERVLGFERGEVHRDESGGVQHAEMRFRTAILMLGSAGVGREPFRSLPVAPRLIYTGIDDVDALNARAVEAGADIAYELTETDYGSRDFSVRDPEGNLWAFGTYRPDS